MTASDDQTISPAVRVLVDAREHWHEAFNSYHDPQRFFRFVEAMIQCLRNATWRLQAVKNRFANFDDWYQPWQETMGANPKLRWLNDARIDITKKTGLISESYAAVSVIESFLESPIYILRLPADLSTSELVNQTVDQLPQEDRQYKAIEIRRRWISPDFPTEELLTVLSECLTHLFEVLQDAERVLLNYSDEEGLQSQTLSAFFELKADPSEIPLLINADSLAEIRHATYPVKSDIPISVLKEKYGTNYEDRPPEDPREKARFLHHEARRVFKTDGFHAGMFILSGGDGEGEIMMFAPADKREKFLIARRLADVVKANQYDLVVLISESWMVSLPENPGAYVEVEPMEGKREILGTWMESREGDRIAFASEILRDGDSISLGEVMTLTAPSNVFEPVRHVWGAARSS